MLTDDATLAMPPTASWLRGRDAIGAALLAGPLSGALRWRLVQTSANAQIAMGVYALAPAGPLQPYGVTVLSLRDDLVAEITTFGDPSAPARFGLS